MGLIANQKLIEGQNDSIGEAKDRISELPDSILHYILSLIETKFVARTSLLSKRWNHIWASIPVFKFPYWSYSKPPSLSEINNFMDFVDRTLHLRDPSSDFQKVYLQTHKHMNPSRVHSWITYITRRNVQELILDLKLEEPFSLPLSLFTCESLSKLELSAPSDIHIPKSFSFPNLKSLELRCIQFTDDCWNGQHFSYCPILENLILANCTWFGMRKFSILTPALKVLEIENDNFKEDGLCDCELQIYAPNLVSLAYMDAVARDYDISSFVKLDNTEFYFNKYDEDERIGHGAAVRKFLQALSHVKSLMTGALDLEAALFGEDYINSTYIS